MSYVERLRAGDAEVWEQAFPCLFPVAHEAARSRLGDANLAECEDVAIESLADLVQSAVTVGSDQELKPLVAAIARNKATDRVRRLLAAKRGGNTVESLESLQEAGGGEPIGQAHENFIDQLTINELRELLAGLASQIKKEHRVVLRDHYLGQLTYEEIAKKHKISVNSVGVYLKRGLTAMKSVLARKPKLMNELVQLVGEGGMVRVLLPLASAIELGRWFVESGGVRYQEVSQLSTYAPHRSENTPAPDQTSADGVRLAVSVENLPAAAVLEQSKREKLLALAAEKYPAQFEAWHRQQESSRQRREAERANGQCEKKRSGCGTMLVALVLIALAILIAAL